MRARSGYSRMHWSMDSPVCVAVLFHSSWQLAAIEEPVLPLLCVNAYAKAVALQYECMVCL